MKTFRYKGVSSGGVPVSGVIRATDEFAAVCALREEAAFVTKIEQVRERNSGGRSNAPVRDRELALLCAQFFMILRSGLPIVRCVELVAAQWGSSRHRQSLYRVAEDIAGGGSIAGSFVKNMPGLPATFVETVRAGEQSGTLELCFQRLHTMFDRAAKTKAKVISALTYPAIVLCVAMAVFLVIVAVAVPMFMGVFREMGGQLPAITRCLLAVSDFLAAYGWLLLVLAAAAAVTGLLAGHTEKGRRWLAVYAWKHAAFRSIRVCHGSARFADTLSVMLVAGLPMPRALELTARVMPNAAFGEAVGKVLQKVQQGQTLSRSMAQTGYFPAMLTEMTAVGEQAGSLEETLNMAADYYHGQVQQHSQRLLAALEPAITVLLAVFTLLLLLAVYLPLLQMYGTVI